MRLSDTFNIETELADDDGLFIDVRGFGVVHLGVSLDKLEIGVYASRSAALPKAELVVPHETFGGDKQPQLYVRSNNPLRLDGLVSPTKMLETAVEIIDHAQRIYQMDGVTWPRKYELIYDIVQTVPRLRDLGIRCERCLDKGYFGDGDPKGTLEIVLNLLQQKRNELVMALSKVDQLGAPFANLDRRLHGEGT